MSTARSGRRPETSGGSARAWRDALVAVVAGFVVMIALASAGLAYAGAAGLPGGAFPRVVAAVVVMAAGGSMEVSGGAGFLAGADASLSVLPLSVSLGGALTAGSLFLRPLHNRAVAGPRELLARAGPLVLLWLLRRYRAAHIARKKLGVLTGYNPLGPRLA
ncbi:streptophobe family protein, partial [Streptomyces goshikiensis]